MKKHRLVTDSGAVTPFMVLLSLALIAMIGLVYDGGRAIGQKSTATALASEAARAAAAQLDLDHYRTTGLARLDVAAATAEAHQWLGASDHTGSVTASTEEVTVIVTVTEDTHLVNLVGVSTLSMTAEATATPRHGVSEPLDAQGEP